MKICNIHKFVVMLFNIGTSYVTLAYFENYVNLSL